jgi:hypothetical protein
MEEIKPFVVMGKKIFMIPLKCPKCDKFFHGKIEQIKAQCTNCNTIVEKDINARQDGEFQKGFSQMALSLVIKFLGEQDSVEVFYTDDYQEAVNGLVGQLDKLGVFEIQRAGSVVKENPDRQKYTTKKLIVEFREKIKYYRDKEA